jgi:hypothetical protein
VDFPDAAATDSPTTLYNRLKPSINWYNVSSYGRMNLQIETHMKFLRMKGRSDSYGWSRNTVGLKMGQYISDAISASGSTSPFKTPLDALYIVSTRAAKNIWFSPTSPSPWRGANGLQVTGGIVTFGQDMWGAFVSTCFWQSDYSLTIDL